jgi:hypothetical protein
LLARAERQPHTTSATEIIPEDPARRIPRPSPARKTHWKKTIAASAAALGLFAAGYLYLHRRPKLTDKDMVVLADFTNASSDAEFDSILHEALAIQLEESPFLRVLSDERVGEDLQFMSWPRGTLVTNELAREICQRENEKAMIRGSISNIGKVFSITIRGRLPIQRHPVTAANRGPR